jgi:hypothetical protein
LLIASAPGRGNRSNSAFGVELGVARAAAGQHVCVSLAHGARWLAAAAGLLVRRLDAIEGLGGIDVLCSDKTGTLTVGTMGLHSALDAGGQPGDDVLRWARLKGPTERRVRNRDRQPYGPHHRRCRRRRRPDDDGLARGAPDPLRLRAAAPHRGGGPFDRAGAAPDHRR